MLLRISLTSASFEQHYPLYRASDANCSGEDAAPPEERNVPFEEKYDVLSREASQKVCGDVTSCQCHMGTANGHIGPLWLPAAEAGGKALTLSQISTQSVCPLSLLW